MPVMEASGFRVREAVWRLWQGERDEDALLHGLDSVCTTAMLPPYPIYPPAPSTLSRSLPVPLPCPLLVRSLTNIKHMPGISPGNLIRYPIGVLQSAAYLSSSFEKLLSSRMGEARRRAE